MNTYVNVVEWFLFVILTLCVGYKLFFVLAAFCRRKTKLPNTKELSKIAILFPVYKEAKVLQNSLELFLQQTYPTAYYDVIVIADHFQQEDVLYLKSHFPVRVLDVNFEKSSKAESLKYATQTIRSEQHDVVVILDVDNYVNPDFLEKINQAYQSGCMIMQAHRIASGTNSKVAMLDAATEEINNIIYRKGHVAAGVSAALIGSGMALDAKWFYENVKQLSTVGEDKELELLLCTQNIFVHYLDDVEVYDQKVSKSSAFYRQRRRWMSSQVQMLGRALRQFPRVYKHANFDYYDKLIQWAMLPNSLLVFTNISLVVLCAMFAPSHLLKWLLLFAMLLLTIFLALPRKFYSVYLLRSLVIAPWLTFLMLLNLTKLREGRQKFIATEHK